MKQFLKPLKDWERQIVDKYPLIYKEANILSSYSLEGISSQPTFTNLRYGFEFEEGWAKIVDEFSNTAHELVLHLRKTTQANAAIHSFIFKEKFGRLTWQGNDNLEEPFKSLFRGYVQYVENSSTYTCEICGKYGGLHNKNGWRKTLCSLHAEELGYQRGILPNNI